MTDTAASKPTPGSPPIPEFDSYSIPRSEMYETDAYKGFAFAACRECGALITERSVHDAWHGRRWYRRRG